MLNRELAEHIDNERHDFEKDIEVTILKQGFKSAEERKFFEDKFICALGTYTPDGLNKTLGNYTKRCTLYTKITQGGIQHHVVAYLTSH